MGKHPTLDPVSYYLIDLVITVPQNDTLEGDIEPQFNITQATVRGLQDSLESLTMDTTTVLDRDNVPVTTIRPIVFPLSSAASYDYPIGGILWNSTNLTAEFDALANHLTVEFRSSLPSRLTGTLHLYSLHVKVQWAYLVLPAFALAVGWAYLALVALQTRRTGFPVAKESVYPTLAYGFDKGTQGFLKKLESGPKAALKLRDNLVVGLADRNDGMRLEMTGDSACAGNMAYKVASMESFDTMVTRPAAGDSSQNRAGNEEGQLRRAGSAPQSLECERKA